MAGHIGTSDSPHWCTPSRILLPVRGVFDGEIDLDPCSNENSIVGAGVEFRLPKHDGLLEPWMGHHAPQAGAIPTKTRVFVNPPFGRCYMHRETKVILGSKAYQALPDEEKRNYRGSTIGDWLFKASLEARCGAEIIAIAPAAVDTAAWQDNVFPIANAICFLRGRMRFLGASNGPAPMACAMIYWGKRSLAFENAFLSLGTVWMMR